VLPWSKVESPLYLWVEGEAGSEGNLRDDQDGWEFKHLRVKLL
jgi:hypothetical protein